MSKMKAYCGLICSDCPTFLATKNDDNEARKKTAALYAELYGFNWKPEEINCDGCLTIGGRRTTYCQNCEIRQCCSKKGEKSCVHCSEHPRCKILKDFHEFSAVAKACFEASKKETED